MSPALLATAAVVLAASGLAHAATHGSTRRAVVAHGVLGARWAGPVVVLLAAVELLLGAGLLAAVLLGDAPVQRGLGLTAAALFLLLAGYAHAAWRARPGAAPPCACGVGESPLGPWVTLRAVLLGLLALGGAVAVEAAGVAGRPWHEVVVLVSATTALSVGLTYLPAARALSAPLVLGRATS